MEHHATNLLKLAARALPRLLCRLLQVTHIEAHKRASLQIRNRSLDMTGCHRLNERHSPHVEVGLTPNGPFEPLLALLIDQGFSSFLGQYMRLWVLFDRRRWNWR